MLAFSNPESTEADTPGADVHKRSSPVHVGNGTRTPPTRGDITPTQSRTTSPFRADLFIHKDTLASRNSLRLSKSIPTDELDASNAGVDQAESNPVPVPESSYAQSSPTATEHDSIDTPIFPNLSSSLPSRSLTPKLRSAPTAVDGTHSEKEMPSSSPHTGSTPGPSRATPARRQHVQLQQQPPQPQHRGPQQYPYYPPSPSDTGMQRNPAAVSGQNSQVPLGLSQQSGMPQQQGGFARQYTLSPQSASLYSQHQHQHQYSYPPPMSLPGMPPMAHAHSHSTPDFFPLGHSMSPTQPPLYAPSFQTSVAPDHGATPALAFDYDGRNTGRSPAPAPGPSSPYTPHQPFSPYSFHPTLTTTPQFAQSQSPFSTQYQAQQAVHTQRPQYPQSFSYMSGTSPTTAEDTTQAQHSTTWWYIPPHSAPPGTAPYTGVYYSNAYANPANAGMGYGFSSLSSPSSSAPAQPQTISLPDAAMRSRPGSGVATVSEENIRRVQGLNEGTEKSDLSSPPAIAVDDSISEHGGQRQEQNRQSSRRSMLPNPPVQRSEWVMWVGNVPSDATHDELWKFFTRPAVPNLASPVEATRPHGRQSHQFSHLPAGLLSPSGSSSASDGNSTDTSGVASVFLIARSNCAFVNYTSAAHLAAAVQRFNGIPLRFGDPRCPRLVCRVRGKEEDLRAGVGGQRGTGIHKRWIREQQGQESVRLQNVKHSQSIEPSKAVEDASVSEPPGTPSSSVVHTESGPESGHEAHPVRRPPHHSSSSGSTTSGFLARYFPKRYFILKSLTQYDLDLSVEKGLWATQPHNEGVLNQAYRNSQDVFLIFGVNKSGEFYGYARMEGLIGKATDDHVSWASRSDSQHSHSPARSFASSVAGKNSQVNETIPEESENNSPEEIKSDETKQKVREGESHPMMLFSPSERRLAENSPQPVTPSTQKRLSKAEEAGSGEINLAEGGSAPVPSDQQHEETISSRQKSRVAQRPNSPTSAPPVMGPQYRRISTQRVEGLSSETLDPRLLRQRLPSVHLDSDAPLRAIRDRTSLEEGSSQSVGDDDRIKRRDTLNTSISTSGPSNRSHGTEKTESSELPMSQEREDNEGEQVAHPHIEPEAQIERTDLPAQWGAPFKVHWIRVKKLPFHRTRHLRNPWNHDREVKVSRDGTELEPSVGQALLDEWDKEETPDPSIDPGTGGAGGASTSSPVAGKRGSQFRRIQPQAQELSTATSEPGPNTGSSRTTLQKQRQRRDVVP